MVQSVNLITGGEIMSKVRLLEEENEVGKCTHMHMFASTYVYAYVCMYVLGAGTKCQAHTCINCVDDFEP